jgi:tetratricopeptide (TPR) repeat protein
VATEPTAWDLPTVSESELTQPPEVMSSMSSTGIEGFPQIDGYRIVDKLGEGGMGVVYRAIQSGTRREVALKLIGAMGAFSQRARSRFEREVELASSLVHPHIARVYDTGLHRGLYYYAMELIGGSPLDRTLPCMGDDDRRVIAMMKLVCGAVEHAHSRGVIHRDLKPSNILVSEDGQPHLLDFGLAKSFEGHDPGVTRSGELAGTPGYMAPEQAGGRDQQIGTATDVYTLGVITYKMLTGRLPHDTSGSLVEVLTRIDTISPVAPRRVRPDLNLEIEAILLKALAHEPAQRYRSAGELADDLGNYLAGEPVRARRPTTWYLLSKRARRHRIPLTIASLIALLMLAGVVFYILAIRQEQARTEQARLDALRQSQLARERAIEAIAHRNLALDTLNRVVFEVQRRLVTTQADLVLRRELLELALAGLAKVQSSDLIHAGPAARTTASAFVLIGDVMMDAGRFDTARDSYLQALAMFEGLSTHQVAGIYDPRDQLIATMRLAQLALRQDQPEEAHRQLQRAQEAIGHLTSPPVDAALLRRDRLTLAIAMGDLARMQTDWVAAEQHYTAARAHIDSLPDDSSDTQIADRCLVWRRLAEVHLALGHAGPATELLEQAMEELGRHSGADPAITRVRGQIQVRLAEAHLMRGEPKRAADEAAAAVASFESLLQNDSERPDWQMDLAVALMAQWRSTRALDDTANSEVTRAYAHRVLATIDYPGGPMGADRLRQLRYELDHADVNKPAPSIPSATD